MEEIGPHGGVGVVDGQGLQGLHRSRALVDGVVDENVETTESRRGRRGHLLDRAAVEEVHGEGVDPAPGGGDVAGRAVEAAR